MSHSQTFRSAVVLYNPVARGLSRHRKLLDQAVRTLSQQGIAARLEATEAAGSAGHQARRAIEGGADLILAAGGDGTINEVAAGMLHSAVPLAILPGGTANVLAREMRLPIHIGRAAALLSGFERRAITVGRLSSSGETPRVFLCMTGVGLDADIVSRVDPDLKVRTGKFSYWVSGFGHFFRPLPEFEVNVDGREYRAGFALVSRVRNYGGDLEIARRASLLRDDFEIVLFRGQVRARYLSYFLAVGLRQAHRVPGCTVMHARRISCMPNGSGPVLVQVDGELAGSLPAAVDLLPSALTMLVPPSYVDRERRFLP